MKVTNGEIRLMKEGIGRLSAMKLPVAVSFKLAKLANKVDEEFQAVETVRLKLVNQYGVKGENGVVDIKGAAPEEQEKFWIEFLELLNQEVELDFKPIKLPETLEVEPSILMPLAKFIDV